MVRGECFAYLVNKQPCCLHNSVTTQAVVMVTGIIQGAL